jgi:serine protease Do
MQNRSFGFLTMLLVMGVSIVLGMILGGKLNAPRVMLAAGGPAPLQLAPALAVTGGSDLAEVVERSLPAVVTVTGTARGEEAEEVPGHPFLEDPFFRRFPFFGEPDEEEEPRTPQRRIGAGSGFILSPDGYVLTNNHVVDGYERVEVTLTDGATFLAEVVGADPSIDLALLKVDPEDRDLPTLPLGDSDALRVGEWVIAIGNPHEFDQTVTVGVVSGKGRRVPLPDTDLGVASFLQTDAAINFGNSGGPLLDARGNVVGINTAIRRQNLAEGIGFALPVNQARAVMEQLRRYGEVRRGWIGITMSEPGIDETTREYYSLPDRNGVLVTEVTEDGPAEEGGLRQWDVIREVDGEAVRDNLDMIGKITARMPDEKVRLTVYRDGRTRQIDVTLGDRRRGLDDLPASEQQPEPSRRDTAPEESSGLGLTVESLDARARSRLGLEDDTRGVVITEVEFDSEADRKGVRPTMVVRAVNDRPVRNVSDWEGALEQLRSGAPVKLDVSLPGDLRRVYFLRAP